MRVPRAIWIALLSVGALVILNAFATTPAHPNPADVAALYGRYQGVLSRTRAHIVLNVLAVAWLAFETVNVAWPRTSLAPVDVYQIWAAPMVVGVIALAGLDYFFTARPTDGR